MALRHDVGGLKRTDFEEPMKTNSLITPVVLATALFAVTAVAQTAAPAATPTPAAMASPAGPMPAPNSTIFVPRLPTPADLSNAAAAQGLAIAKMEQTTDHITVVYQYADGQTNTIAYYLLSAAGSAIAPGAPAPVSATVVVPATATAVVYPQPVYYYDPFYYGYEGGWPWYAPVSLSFGFGYNYGHFGGGHYGGGHYGRGHFGGGRGFHHR
jgi:hypothetical protein